MQFRYKLAKETFKGKKLPPKVRVADTHVSADQRGNDSRLGDEVMSLDKDTITAKPKPSSEKTRRELFNFGRFGAYADQLSEKFKEPLEKKGKKGKKKRKLKAPEIAVAPIAQNVTPVKPKVGFSRRIWNWITGLFRRTPEPIIPLVQPVHSTEPVSNTIVEAVNTAPVSPAISLPVAEISSPTTPKKIKKEEPPVKKEGISFSNLFDDTEEDQEPEEEINRRNLLRKSVHFLAKPMVDSVQSKVDQVNEVMDKVTKRVPLLRPPGAVTERMFLQLCTRCDKCVHACPKDAIKKAPKEFGMLVLGTPYIDPLKKPCVMCDDLPCISACPETALMPVASPAEVKMGYAILDQAKCMAYGDSFCQQCVLDCPIPGAITQVKDRPVIHKDICTGCGVCLKSCNTVNTPVAIKIKPQMVVESQIRKREMEKLKAQQKAEKLASQAVEAVEQEKENEA